MHTCPLSSGPVPHVGGPILPPGMPTVLIGGLPAARVTDLATCVGPPDTIIKGSPTVLIGGLMAARMGDNTVHGGVIVAGNPTVLIGDASSAASFGPAPMNLAAAQLLMDVMAAQADIAFKFPVDGCYARAHLMVQRMQQMGATPGKAWTFASSNSDPLWVATPNHPDNMVSWGYHVAPTVPVLQPDGTVRDMVVDPSMFDHPVTVPEWRDAQHDHPSVVQTIPGAAPDATVGGSGYWPGPDPAEGVDTHALETMQEYKRLERTRGH